MIKSPSHLKLVLIVITSIVLAACGGGVEIVSNGSTSESNQAPTFSTASASISVQENITGVIYTAQATDAEGNTITYSLSGGTDQSQFSISSSSGELQFNSSPDYDNPNDSNEDNVYEVEISAGDNYANTSSGSDITSMLLSVTVTNADNGNNNTDTTAPTEPNLVSLASAAANSPNPHVTL